ncbi:hypothetical protein DFH28DRAFT_1085935 [Melampsora americana]|nr:hypothetical protein DFH28DRAFT_1085935 [Melampsora americana]
MGLTLVHSTYQFVTPGYLPEVGVNCLVCGTQLIYWEPKRDAWFLGCPKSKNHNTRIWRCDQFKYKQDLINAGHPTPIISTEEDWGPRISPESHVLEPRPLPPPPMGDFLLFLGHSPIQSPPVEHPFQGHVPPEAQFSNQLPWLPPVLPPTAAQFSNLPTWSPAGVLPPPSAAQALVFPHQVITPLPCQRQGPTPKGQCSKANRKCRFQYCQACCNTYGPGPLGTSGQLAWSPTALHKNCAARFQLEIKDKYDKNKMVTIYVWLNFDQPYSIAHRKSNLKLLRCFFPNWPQAHMEECDLLMQAVRAEVGEHWNRVISLWDEVIDAWRKIPVAYPLHYPPNNRTIVVWLAKVNSQTPGLPQSAAGHLPFKQDANPSTPKPISQNCPRMLRMQGIQGSHTNAHFKHPESPKHPHYIDLTSSPLQRSLPESLLPKINSVQSPLFVVKTEPSWELVASEQASTSGPQHVCPDHTTTIDQKFSTDFLFILCFLSYEGLRTRSFQTRSQFRGQSNVNNSAGQLQSQWPSSLVLVSTLLAWYHSTTTNVIIMAWREYFGHEWNKVPPTIYRYRSCIAHVTYKRFVAAFQSKPHATVGQACIRFRGDFQAVSRTNCGKKGLTTTTSINDHVEPA